MTLRLHPSAIGMINVQGCRSLPVLTVDLAHSNLAQGEQRPEPHCSGVCGRQHCLRLDPSFAPFVQALDRGDGGVARASTFAPDRRAALLYYSVALAGAAILTRPIAVRARPATVPTSERQGFHTPPSAGATTEP